MKKEVKLVHGGDWAGFREKYGYDALDFSADVSPLGVPLPLKDAAMDTVRTLERYPDPLCRELIRSLSAFEDVPEEWILAGNGAADLIFKLVHTLKPKKALLPAPAFAEYEEALRSTGCEITYYYLKEERDFHTDESLLDAITEDVDMVFLCEPNNPTGLTSDRALLEQVLRRCSRTGAMLFLDECFNDFLDDPKAHTMKACLGAYENLFILKSFTKMYAMAGARLGYCLCSDTGLMERMRGFGQPWPVSSFAQNMGIAALRQTDYAEAVRDLTGKERRRMQGALKDLGCRVIPGEANYLLFKSIPDLKERLMERGILIRACSNYHGLDENWFRIGIRTQTENDRLLAAMKEILTAAAEME